MSLSTSLERISIFKESLGRFKDMDVAVRPNPSR